MADPVFKFDDCVNCVHCLTRKCDQCDAGELFEEEIEEDEPSDNELMDLYRKMQDDE